MANVCKLLLTNARVLRLSLVGQQVSILNHRTQIRDRGSRDKERQTHFIRVRLMSG